jgi:hypothetical protein
MSPFDFEVFFKVRTLPSQVNAGMEYRRKNRGTIAKPEQMAKLFM